MLIPGIGYGRNAQVFRDAGMTVTGIKIAQTALDIARRYYGPGMTMYHGSVTAMPFDERHYDGIFCHVLLHLLDGAARKKLLHDCYNQLAANGCMVFMAIAKQAPSYGTGT